jgi:anti-sigma factor RsiW
MVHAAEGTLQAYLDGEIDSAAEHALRDHVAACAVCAAELETLRRVAATVHGSLVLLDRPAPVLRAQAAIARERRSGGRRMARLGAWGLAKAAMLMLVLAGAGAAAIPDVRRALESTFSRVVSMFGGGQTQEQAATAPVRPEPVEPEVAPVPAMERGESFVAPADGRVQIVLDAPAGTLEVIARLVDGAHAHVETTTSGPVARRSSTGRLELRGLGEGTVTIGIPRDLANATIVVDGVVRVYKDGGVLRGSDTGARGSEVRFIVGP